MPLQGFMSKRHAAYLGSEQEFWASRSGAARSLAVCSGPTKHKVQNKVQEEMAAGLVSDHCRLTALNSMVSMRIASARGPGSCRVQVAWLRLAFPEW